MSRRTPAGRPEPARQCASTGAAWKAYFTTRTFAVETSFFCTPAFMKLADTVSGTASAAVARLT